MPLSVYFPPPHTRSPSVRTLETVLVSDNCNSEHCSRNIRPLRLHRLAWAAVVASAALVVVVEVADTTAVEVAAVDTMAVEVGNCYFVQIHFDSAGSLPAVQRQEMHSSVQTAAEQPVETLLDIQTANKLATAALIQRCRMLVVSTKTLKMR